MFFLLYFLFMYSIEEDLEKNILFLMDLKEKNWRELDEVCRN